ncbi:prolyl oligopeptidase-like protein [Rhizodiscina lignyota]|uniref:Carboxylic ester hydrolase n=1 Tax=Rhizodiscina lignyota TaxID=1504668 RepID=A0A9P4MB55_9PEZI|nr:prolyl oligopeptidase-like protein [Rhizodiscina lignyota]
MHSTYSFLPFLALVGLLTSLTQATPYVHDPRHNLSYQGVVTSPGIETFFGIPYGVSTCGSNRFTAPKTFVPPARHVFNATAPGDSCPQIVDVFSELQGFITGISEDCLNLNVARPAGRKSGEGLLPVMVWIYGGINLLTSRKGGLNTGSASLTSTTPDGMIRQSVENGLPVLYVAMNYRLGIFGFATSEALRGSKSLNLGLKDQRLALEWVQSNIAAFGGDPNRVTIFGQSSGALSVGLQIIAYGESRPTPFHSAIIQSTALEPGMASNISFNATAAIAVIAGCLDGPSASAFSPKSASQSPAVISCLRSRSVESLLNATAIFADETAANNDGDIFLPTVDQDFLPTRASEILSSGKFPRMPLILGWDENDATLFTARSIKTPADTRAFISTFYPYLTSSIISELLDLYPSTDFQPNVTAGLSAEFYRSAEISRDIFFVCPSIFFGGAMAKKYSTSSTVGPAECVEPPVYLYDNNQIITSNLFAAFNMSGLGVLHGSELSYLTGNLSLSNFTALGIPGFTFSPSAEDYVLEKQYPRSWTSFAWRDTPTLQGKDTLPGWKSAFPEGKGDGDVYVIGGEGEELGGMNGQYNTAIAKERLGQKCALLNRADVIKQLMY